MRADQFNVTAVIDGKNLGTFDKLSGGEVDSEETRYRPGGLGKPISLGGAITVNNVTISRLFDLAREQAIIHWLISRAGKGKMTINKQPLDVDGNVYGRPLVYTGKLKQVTPPEHDSESSDAALLELEMVPSGTVT
jgi:hypothetical protein